MSRADGNIPGARLWLPSAQPQRTEGPAAGGGGCWCHSRGTWVALTGPVGVWTALRSLAFTLRVTGGSGLPYREGNANVV